MTKNNKPLIPSIIKDDPLLEEEIIARIERGLSIDAVASSMSVNVQKVLDATQSPEGVELMKQLRAQRELKVLMQREGFIQLREKAMDSVASVLDDPEAKPSDKLRAANMIFERDPERVFTKTERKEFAHTHDVHYNVDEFSAHVGQVLIDADAQPCVIAAENVVVEDVDDDEAEDNRRLEDGS